MSEATRDPNRMTTEERNAWFSALSPKEQRKQLARDILEQLQAPDPYLRPISGYGYMGLVDLDHPTTNPQEALQQAHACACCMLGALFIARVRNYDGYEGGSFIESSYKANAFHMHAALATVFSDEQRHYLECFFEGWKDFLPGGSRMVIHDDLETAEARARYLMERLLEHDGDVIAETEAGPCRID